MFFKIYLDNFGPFLFIYFLCVYTILHLVIEAVAEKRLIYLNNSVHFYKYFFNTQFPYVVSRVGNPCNFYMDPESFLPKKFKEK